MLLRGLVEVVWRSGRNDTSMATPDTLRYVSIPLVHAPGVIPAVGFGTLIHDHVAARQASKTALEVGYRHLDCAERYRTEEAVGEAMQESFRAGTIRRADVFVTTKLWNTNHRPERAKPAFDASRRRLQIDYVDCYIIHTPFAFQPGDDQDPTDERGQVLYDFRRDVARDVASARAPRGRGPVQIDRFIRCHFGDAAGDLRRCPHQARVGPGRMPSILPAMGPYRLLPRTGDCRPSRGAAGARLIAQNSSTTR